MNRKFIVILVVVFLAGSATLAYTFQQRLKTTADLDREIKLAGEVAATIHENTVVPTDQRVRAGDNFASILQKFGLSADEAAGASSAAQRAFNLRQVRAGNTVTVGRSIEGQLREIDYKIDADRMLKITPENTGYIAQIREIPSRTEIVAVSGTLQDSLFNAIEDAGESAELAMRLSQIFGYDLDFYTDPRKGDSFRVVLEKRKYANGQTAAYGKIYAAEYDNGGKKYQALLFHDPAGQPGYYTADGKSLQKAFLRSPLKFGALVTSHFSKARFHPILKTYRAHMGTDYGAPIGTPVQTIGSGKVVFAGRKNGEGNMIQISHANGYETMYLHLSKMFVRGGEHIEIGKTIGLVGSTGLSTGPHLDFRILQRGQYKNFEKLGLPPSDPVSKKNWPEFAELREKWLPLLKNPELLQANAANGAAPTASR
ncbi:MAG: peptidoglycan DD-metalloendopeptidase family protein [Acidobacteria bacterium]|nr:peptidoglycan DD-metalloendopeptidase family protein [Acidobacteriota bacterium]MBS1865438.1 peptidoglycan DD-metalloendopeptidase family protein [Acidobacteriota bacterium]